MNLAADPVVLAALHLALALLFAWAASHKLRDPSGFRVALTNYELLPERLTGVAARMLATAELGIALGLVMPTTARTSAAAATAILLLYAGAIAINLVRGRRDLECGCAGIGRTQVSAALVLRNAVLAAGALICLLPTSPRPLGIVDAITIGAALGTLIFLYAAADGLIAIRQRATHRVGFSAAKSGLPPATSELSHA